jgi:polyhydroxyalkanoate synthase subunit PhaC
MQEIAEFTFSGLCNNIVKLNPRIVRNYIKNFSGYHHDLRDIGQTYFNFLTKLYVKPSEMIKVSHFYTEYLKSRQALWYEIFLGQKSPYDLVGDLDDIKDNRFSHSEWEAHPYFNFLKLDHLLLEKLSLQIIDEIELDNKLRKKLDFYTEQYMSAFSPSNFPFSNPEVLALAIETKGKSLWDGFNYLVEDLEKGKITQTDDSAFEVGENLAITQGTVVYENELIQLIQYTSKTKNVFERPLLIIPPWINKYYILDLQPKNSFVKFLVDNGVTVFMISWRNPKSEMGKVTFDDYVAKGALKAIEVANKISNSKKINTLGYCLGGTLLSIAVSILSGNKKENPVNSATFLASMIDFSDIGPMGDIIDKALISKLERGELMHNGILNGADMETAFNLIRPNDLIWNYVVSNYLKGIKPSAFDVMYWTNDNTNLPAAMYVYYMKYMISGNKLSRKNALTIDGTAIDIGKIEIPVCVIGMKDDTISPAITTFTTTDLVSGDVEFILGDSGHVMGTVNPPIKKKYGYAIGGTLGKGFEEWQKTATHHDGSWWTVWLEKLLALSGKEIAASAEEGSDAYKPIEPAPGRYVKEKC